MEDLIEYTRSVGLTDEMLSLLVFMTTNCNARIPRRFLGPKYDDTVLLCLNRGFLLNNDNGEVVVTKKFQSFLETLKFLSGEIQ